eukprot:gene6713-7806_t
MNKVVVITGANAGLGKEIAKRLALKEAHVILACRTERKALEAVAEIKQLAPNATVDYMLLDLLSFESIKSFTDAFRARSLPLDVLINNAGIMWLWEDKENNPPLTMIDGGQQSFNTQFAANYLDNLTGNNSATFATYCQSKQAQIGATYELQRRIDQAATNLPGRPTISALHPGIFASEIVSLPFPLRSLYHAVFKSAAYCSTHIVRVITGAKYDGGKYYDHSKLTKSSNATYDYKDQIKQ